MGPPLVSSSLSVLLEYSSFIVSSLWSSECAGGSWEAVCPGGRTMIISNQDLVLSSAALEWLLPWWGAAAEQYKAMIKTESLLGLFLKVLKAFYFQQSVSSNTCTVWAESGHPPLPFSRTYICTQIISSLEHISTVALTRALCATMCISSDVFYL